MFVFLTWFGISIQEYILKAQLMQILRGFEKLSFVFLTLGLILLMTNMFNPVNSRVNPKVIITSDDYPNSQWDLRSSIVFAVDIEEVDDPLVFPSDCWFLDVEFHYHLFSGDYSFIFDAWRLSGLPFPEPEVGDYGVSYRRRTLRPRFRFSPYVQIQTQYIQDLPERLQFAPPNQTLYICFDPYLSSCDDD